MRLPARYGQRAMANMHGKLPMRAVVDEQARETHCNYSWNGPMVLTISTVLPEPTLALELISTYIGHPQTKTVATHLRLGPIGHLAELDTAEHEHEQLDPIDRPRECAYDHAHQLIEHLRAVGHRASVELDDRSFTALEAVE
jgi:hypothetical protein